MTSEGKMISKQTAMDIAYAYREIETAEKLLEEISKSLKDRDAPDIRDAFGRRQGGLQLGVPSGGDSRRLFDVPWELCKPIIEAHIARHKCILAVQNEKALIEARGETP
jgi:hypothetical protein